MRIPLYYDAGRTTIYHDQVSVTPSSRCMYFDTAYASFADPYAQSGTADRRVSDPYNDANADRPITSCTMCAEAIRFGRFNLSTFNYRLSTDSHAGLYDFPAREYSIQGRWPSPDPAGLAAVDLSNPQSWNRYAYVINNPLAWTDPFGLDPCPNDNSWGAQLCKQAQAFRSTTFYAVWNQFTLLFTTGCSESGCATTIDPRAFNLLGLFGTSGGSSPCLGGAGPLQPGQSRCNDPCANKTLAATGVDIQQNIVQAQTTISLGRMRGVTGGSYNDATGSLGALYNYGMLVGTGGPQDIKNQPGPGTFQQRVDAGNISFGVTCSFGDAFCQFAAGLAQTMSGNPNFQGTLKTGLDTPSDNAAIRVGQAMRAAGCHE